MMNQVRDLELPHPTHIRLIMTFARLRFHISLSFALTLPLLLSACSSMGGKPSGPPTTVTHRAAADTLEGKKPLTLQWISWDHFGVADVRKMGKTYWISGSQRSKVNQDFLKINGRITQIDATGFTFDGEITIQVYHINRGRPFTRTGLQRFTANPQRGYWRLANMRNNYGVIDYVDIFFNIDTARSKPSGRSL